MVNGILHVSDLFCTYLRDDYRLRFFEEIRSKNFVFPTCAFAGNSVGEYSALAFITNAMPIASLVDVVFHHGTPMQKAVERYAQNCSNYAMRAVNPCRITLPSTMPLFEKLVKTSPGHM